MIRKVLIKIGSKSIILYNKLLSKSSPADYDNKIIEKQTIDEIIKQNQENKNNIDYRKLAPLSIIILIYIVTGNLMISLEFLTVIILFELAKRGIPKIRKENEKTEIMQKYPYALRQMSTQLKAGLGLYDAIKSIAEGNYGKLSEEFQITINEIQYGTSYVDSFNNLSKRTEIKSIEKLVSQIIRTLNNGGNLADTLTTLADENSYNMKIKYKEFSEKLNAIMLLYMFIAVLFPVILFILIIAATTVMGSVIKPELLLILYLFFFPMIIMFMILLIKRMEPSIN